MIWYWYFPLWLYSFRNQEQQVWRNRIVTYSLDEFIPHTMTAVMTLPHSSPYTVPYSTYKIDLYTDWKQKWTMIWLHSCANSTLCEHQNHVFLIGWSPRRPILESRSMTRRPFIAHGDTALLWVGWTWFAKVKLPHQKTQLRMKHHKTQEETCW